jgi:peroxiredoxin
MFFREDELNRGLIYLSDPEQAVIGRYGLKDTTVGRPIARPASFILDAQGVILWRHLPDDWRFRTGPQAYLEAFDKVLPGGGHP